MLHKTAMLFEQVLMFLFVDVDKPGLGGGGDPALLRLLLLGQLLLFNLLFGLLLHPGCLHLLLLQLELGLQGSSGLGLGPLLSLEAGQRSLKVLLLI